MDELLGLCMIKNNCKFRACKDDNNNIHILDWMKDQPFCSVTNSVDWLVPHVMDLLGVEGEDVSIFLYGTDGVISIYNSRTGEFRYVPYEDGRVHPLYKGEMLRVYGKDLAG